VSWVLLASVMIDGRAYGSLTPEKAIKIIKGIYASEADAVEDGDNA